MKSIIQSDTDRCFICGRRNVPLHEHHIFYGTANRPISEKYGIKVTLCTDCHLYGKNAVHRDSRVDIRLKQMAQMLAMSYYHWDMNEWRRHFDKNVLDDEK